MHTEARAVLEAALVEPERILTNHVLRGASLSEAAVLRFTLDADFADRVTDDVLTAAHGLTGREFLAYDPSYRTSAAQVLVEPLADMPEFAEVDATIRGTDVPTDVGGDDTGVVAMAHTIGRDEGAIVAYRMKGAGIAVRRKQVTLVPRDGHYAAVGGEVLFYEPRFDAYTCGGYAFFTAVSLIQTKLQADAKARSLARTTFATVTQRVRIEGHEELARAVEDDPTLRAKMTAVARIVAADAEYAAHLTTESLVSFAEQHADYHIPVTEVDGQKTLVFDSSPQHRHQIPKLLADDYLHSFLTGRNYEAGSKQPV
ncbi:MAG TPA: hypothetical protein DD664_01255 [Janibacter terrae]|nr:hypothetical protein [Janibacter terrae]